MNANFKSVGTAFDTCAAVAILIGVIGTGSAVLGESLAGRQTVKFQVSSLSTPAGVATLFWDIRSAALRVCTSGQTHLTRSDQVKSCVQEAEARAVKQVNVDALTAYAQIESKAPLVTVAANNVK
jgi:UrcA family protein